MEDDDDEDDDDDDDDEDEDEDEDDDDVDDENAIELMGGVRSEIPCALALRNVCASFVIVASSLSHVLNFMIMSATVASASSPKSSALIALC
jgi:hypothetical protein